MPQDLGSKVSPGTSTYHQRIISNNSFAHNQQGDYLRQEKKGSAVPSIICEIVTIADTLSSSVKVVIFASLAEAERPVLESP